MEHHEIFMRECLDLARRGEGLVSPNPMVGAVLVKDGVIVSRGAHVRFGGDHAEVDCLHGYHGNPAGATLYVNLEPCSHHGKTPPCVDLLLQSRIGTVVCAMADPNPLVNGRGIRKLRRNGVNVITGVLEAEARELNRMFLKRVRTGLPYVHMKIAQTLDGRIADIGDGRTWITSQSSRRRVHQWRREHDAVLLGAGTVIKDNPSITVRLVHGRHPDVVILDGKLRTPPGATVFKELHGRRVFLCTTAESAKRNRRTLERREESGVIPIVLKGKGGQLPLRSVLRRLTAHNVGSLMVEGGARVFTEFLQERLSDELTVMLAPRYAGSGLNAVGALSLAAQSRQASHMSVEALGGDVIIRFRY